MNLYKSNNNVGIASNALFVRILFSLILVLTTATTFSQQSKVVQKIAIRDISDSTRQLFYTQADSLEKFRRGIFPIESDRSRFYTMPCNSLLTYRPSINDPAVCLIKPGFGKTGGIGCGYSETDEPGKSMPSLKQFRYMSIINFDGCYH